MKLEQVSKSCFAVLNQKNRMCDANSGLINLGGGVVIDTQSDLSHGRQMIELFGKVWAGMPRRVINTHEDGDHMWGSPSKTPKSLRIGRSPTACRMSSGPTSSSETSRRMHPGIWRRPSMRSTESRRQGESRLSFDPAGPRQEYLRRGPFFRHPRGAINIFSGGLRYVRSTTGLLDLRLLWNTKG
jgi:hypothetical protein